MAAHLPIRYLQAGFKDLLSRFLQTLSATGRAELPWPGKDIAAFIDATGNDPHDRRLVAKTLAEWHGDAVLDLPGPPLPHHPAAALWGANMIYRATALICFREVEASEVRRLLTSAPMPDADLPAAHFSADLCLRHWPDLTRLARRTSEDDPLVGEMLTFATTIPLSAAGLELPGPSLTADHPVLLHPGLWQLLVERALARSDHALLSRMDTIATIHAKLGTFVTTLTRGLVPPPPSS